MNLNQVTLPVRNMDKATKFYRELGFLQVVDTPNYARFECPEGDSTFSLQLEDSVYNGAIIYFERRDLDAWVDELIAKGFVFDQLPQDMPYAWREAVLKDPSHNKIKLYWAGDARKNPPWRVEKRATD